MSSSSSRAQATMKREMVIPASFARALIAAQSDGVALTLNC